MDSETQREQRRRRILENGRSRMDRILGTVGETQRSEPVIDGLGRSGAIEKPESSKIITESNLSTKEIGQETRKERHSEEDGGIHGHDHSSTNRLAGSSSEQTKREVPIRSKTSLFLRHRQLIFVLFGISLRIALIVNILRKDAYLLPFILAFVVGFESILWASMVVLKSRSRTRRTITDQLKSICGRSIEDFVLVMCGFVLTHLTFSLIDSGIL